MQIIYCEKCGKRITDEASARNEGGHWLCSICRPSGLSASTAMVPVAKVNDDPERDRSTVALERGIQGPPSTATHKRRQTAIGSERDGIGDAPVGSKTTMLLILGAVAAVLVVIALFGIMGSGKSGPAPVASGTAPAPPAAPAAVPATPRPPVPAPTPPAPPVPGAPPQVPVPAPSPAPTAVTPPAITRPGVNEADARQKFTPLKAEFERARGAGDLKTMARVVSELGMITRDYDGTATANEAMALIKLNNEVRAVERIKDLQQEFRQVKQASKAYNELVADAIAALRKAAKDFSGTAAATDAEHEIKTYLDAEAQRLWSRAKDKLADPASPEAGDSVARLLREFAASDQAKEAEKALVEAEKKWAEAQGTSLYLHFQGQLRRAKDTKTLRDLIAQMRTYLDQNLAPEGSRLEELLPRALKMLEETLMPVVKQKLEKNWSTHWLVRRDFFSLEGTKEDVLKDGDKTGVKFSSRAGAPEIRVQTALGVALEDAQLKLAYKAQGLKSLRLLFPSTAHRMTFEFSVPNLRNDEWITLVLPLESVKKDGYSLRNAYLPFMELRAEKSKPDDAAAGLAILSADLSIGRGK